MAKQERAIFTNMCMIKDSDGNILIQDRISSNWPGVTFPGGHVEKDESFVESVIREVKEETGLTLLNPVLCGVKQFNTKDNARYVVFFYKANQFTGELQSSDEGEVFWIRPEELTDYNLANDMMDMIKVFETDELSEFYYYKEKDKWKVKLL